MKRFHVLSLLIAGFSLTGCVGPTIVGLAAGAGATVGIAAAREGGVRSAATDVRIRAEINDKWFKYNLETFRKLNLTVDEGRVLITGIVQNPDARVEAVRLAWQVDGVRQVINEVRVADSQTIASYADDLWITTRLRTAMTFDRDVQSINYSIDTVDGTVYLMGIAQSEKELKHATDLAREIPHVKQVVSYVKRAGEPLPGAEVSPQAPAVARAQQPASSMPPAMASAPAEDLLSQPASPRDLQPEDGAQYSLQPQPVQRQKLN
jgi:osmotically-inducible protein OsmY